MARCQDEALGCATNGWIEMNNTLAFIAALSLLCLSACASSGAVPEHDAAPQNGYLQIVERIDRRVHVMRQAEANFAGVVGNVTIIEQAHGIVLIDSGSSRGDGDRVVAAVRRISAKPVTAVIITHWHNDHPLGLPAIVAAWPRVEIIATEITRQRLEEGQTGVPLARDPAWEATRTTQLQGYVSTMEARASDATLAPEVRAGWARVLPSLPVRIADVPGTYVILPTRTFVDRLTLDDPDVPVEVSFQGRANTDGDAIIWLPRQRILIAGDAVVAPVPYLFAVHTAENIATLERLRALHHRVLIPGHGEVQHDGAFLDLLIDFTRYIQAEVTPLAQQGLTLEEVTARVNADQYAQRFVGDDPWLRYWFGRYSLEPLIESTYREAKGEVFEPS